VRAIMNGGFAPLTLDDDAPTMVAMAAEVIAEATETSEPCKDGLALLVQTKCTSPHFQLDVTSMGWSCLGKSVGGPVPVQVHFDRC
jgi:hypothetical protein